MDLSQALCLPVSVPEILQANQLQSVSSSAVETVSSVETSLRPLHAGQVAAVNLKSIYFC